MILGIFKIAFRLRDRHVFMSQSVKVSNIFSTLTLKQIFWKKKTFFKKLEYHFLAETARIESTSFPYKTPLSEANVKTNRQQKADRNFCGNFLKNHFRYLKLYSNRPSWLARSRCHMGTFWKTKDWSSHFWEGQPFRFWYVEVHRQRRFKSTKTGISS